MFLTKSGNEKTIEDSWKNKHKKSGKQWALLILELKMDYLMIPRTLGGCPLSTVHLSA